MTEKKAFIFNVQKYNTYDGPGVRTIVFFKGCPLRCKWCANPEGLMRKYSIMYKESSCIHCGLCVKACPKSIHQVKEGRHHIDRTMTCIGCRECEVSCPRRAIAIFGEEKTTSQLLELIERDRIFYDVSGGGVTLGGGDVIIQPEAGADLLKACKKNGINTAVETSGYGRSSSLMELAKVTDLFLYDIKIMDSEKHLKYTGVRNEIILENCTQLIKHGHRVLVRVPLIKGINDDGDNIIKMASFLQPFIPYKNFKGVELLPYHKLSLGKYPALGLNYDLKGDFDMLPERLLAIEHILRAAGIQAKVVRH